MFAYCENNSIDESFNTFDSVNRNKNPVTSKPSKYNVHRIVNEFELILPDLI